MTTAAEASRLSSTVRLLVTLVDDRQPGYAAHAHAAARLTRMVGLQLGLDGRDLEHLRLAALLHDAGSLRLPFPHAGSRWRLSAEERRIWETHPTSGGRMVRMLELPAEVERAVAGHHERWDGTGYPLGLSGGGIPLHARILAVCDAYDEARAGQLEVDHERLTEEEALQRLQCDESHRFDQLVVRALCDALGEEREIGALTGLFA